MGGGVGPRAAANTECTWTDRDLPRRPVPMAQWIRREGTKTQFRYRTADGRLVRDARTLERIRALVIPPAWTDVHIAASARDGIQACGLDVKGRKQYRYHERAVERGQLRKYYRVRQLAKELPGIRERVRRDAAVADADAPRRGRGRGAADQRELLPRRRREVRGGERHLRHHDAAQAPRGVRARERGVHLRRQEVHRAAAGGEQRRARAAGEAPHDESRARGCSGTRRTGAGATSPRAT